MDEENDGIVKRKLADKAYRRSDGENNVLGLNLGLKGRTVPRYKRCENCQWFDTEENFDAQVSQRIMADSESLRAQGASRALIDANVKRIRTIIVDNRGMVGYCMRRLVRRDKQAADHFTASGYLCDQWSGAHGMKVGPEHALVEKLPDEILDDMGESNPPRPGEDE